MTIIEAINRIDGLKPNIYSQSEKVRWLSQLDGFVKNDIIDTHEGSDAITFSGYDDETSIDTVLLITSPYEDVYIHYLEMKIDYSNGETIKYNNSAMMYNNAYSAFEKWYNRTHMPKQNGFDYF